MPFWLMQPCTEPQDFHLSYTVPTLLLEQNQFYFRPNIKPDKKIMFFISLLPIIGSYLKAYVLLKSAVDKPILVLVCEKSIDKTTSDSI